MRINKYISSAGVCSRRGADKLVEEKKVKINGKIAETGNVIDTEKDIVEVNGQIIKINEKKVYFILNKPMKVLTTLKDERGRKTVLDIVKEEERIFPIGRLDYDTEGLLIMTNDGELYNRIIHPKSEVYKKYYAKITGKLSDKSKNKLQTGIILEDGKTLPAKLKIIKENYDVSEVEISIREGRNRQVRRMFKACGNEVLYLKRIAIGEMELGDIPIGKYRQLTNREVEYLYSF